MEDIDLQGQVSSLPLRCRQHAVFLGNLQNQIVAKTQLILHRDFFKVIISPATNTYFFSRKKSCFTLKDKLIFGRR